MTLEDRIRDLCTLAVAARDEDEMKVAILQLREALKEHSVNLKMLAAKYPVPVGSAILPK